MERAQRKGVDLEPVVEVESALSALRLAALGVGDTMVARAITRMPERETLPASLAALPTINAVIIPPEPYFAEGVKRLASSIEALIARPSP